MKNVESLVELSLSSSNLHPHLITGSVKRVAQLNMSDMKWRDDDHHILMECIDAVSTFCLIYEVYLKLWQYGPSHNIVLFFFVLNNFEWVIPCKCKPEKCQFDTVSDRLLLLHSLAILTACRHRSKAYLSPRWPPGW